MTTQRAVVYDETGAPDVLHLVEAPIPTPGSGRVLIAVAAVGLNPYDAKVRAGIVPRETPFPRGIGADVAGEVVELGADVTDVAVGDLVYGWGLNTLRERLVVRTSSITSVPDGLDIRIAGALATSGLTAVSAVAAVPVGASDTVLVSSGSGAVGFLMAQLARNAGARVIGTTGAANEQRLRDAGITPVRYGEGLADRVRALAPDGVTAVFDTAGVATLDAAAALGVAPERVYTIADDDLAAQYGVRSPDYAPRSITDLAALGGSIARGEVRFDVAETFPLDDVVAAFTRLETGHPGGKIVVAP